MSDLTPDPQNARKHGARNSDVVDQSLREVGAARSIVIDEAGVILAGNDTTRAAMKAGMKLQVVDTDGQTIIAVRRRGLTPEQKTRLALFDNRSAELGEWDTDVLGALQAADAVAVDDLWTEKELEKLFGLKKAATGESQLGGLEYRVIVDCRDEIEQMALLEKFEKEGLTCRPLIS